MEKTRPAFENAILDSVLSDFDDVPPSESIGHEFSPEFELKAQKLIKKSGSNAWHCVNTAAKRLLIAAIIAALLTGTVLAVPALREGLIKFFIHDNGSMYFFTVDRDVIQNAPEEIETVYTLGYLPDGYDAIAECVTDSNLNHTGIYLYSKGKIMIHLTFDYKTDEKCTTPGQYLKYHRTFQGLTTRELAEKVGIVPATLVLYENDRHPIKHDIAVALANTLGIDRNRLLDEYTTFVDYPYSSLLKKVRHELSLTQMQMAEVIGIGQTTYSGWEREARVPRRKEHDKILAALKKLKVNVDTYLCQSTSI